MSSNLRALLAAALLVPALSPAQPITVIVPFPAGGIAASHVPYRGSATSTPAQFAAFMAGETERLGKVVKASGARAD